MALAAVGCRGSGPAVAEPGATPLLPGRRLRRLNRRLDSRTVARRAGFGLGGAASAALPHRGKPDAAAAAVWASTGDSEANRMRRQKISANSPRNAMPPHDNCYSRRATAQFDPTRRLTLASPV